MSFPTPLFRSVRAFAAPEGNPLFLSASKICRTLTPGGSFSFPRANRSSWDLAPAWTCSAGPLCASSQPRSLPSSSSAPPATNKTSHRAASSSPCVCCPWSYPKSCWWKVGKSTRQIRSAICSGSASPICLTCTAAKGSLTLTVPMLCGSLLSVLRETLWGSAP